MLIEILLSLGIYAVCEDSGIRLCGLKYHRLVGAIRAGRDEDDLVGLCRRHNILRKGHFLPRLGVADGRLSRLSNEEILVKVGKKVLVCADLEPCVYVD